MQLASKFWNILLVPSNDSYDTKLSTCLIISVNARDAVTKFLAARVFPEKHLIAIKSSLHSDNLQQAYIVPARSTPLATTSAVEVPTTITADSYDARSVFNLPVIHR